MSEAVPIRIDFVLITVNQYEDKSVGKVFELANEGKEKDLQYHWGYIQGKETLCIAHVSQHDIPGTVEATQVAAKICDILYPEYLFVLGTAAGRQGMKEEGADDRPELGDIVACKMIRYGTLSKEHLKEQPAMHPDKELYNAVAMIYRKGTWTEDIQTKAPWFTASKVITEELCTTNQIIDNLKKDKKLRNILDKFPRLVAVDMEAGAVGSTLFDYYSTGKWVPRFFVIKGISDIIDNDDSNCGPNGENLSQTETRHLWREYAADASAAFAKNLIVSFKPAERHPTHANRLIPARFQNIRNTNKDCSVVLYAIQAEDYSVIAADILGKLHDNNDYKFFTFCAFNPKSLWKTAMRRYKFKNKSPRIRNDKLIEWTLNNFHHFKMFGKAAKKDTKQHSCIRILLLEGSTERGYDKYWPQHINEEQWNFFIEVNRRVPCWGICHDDLVNIISKDKLFLTDYVVIGERIILDYYDDSKTLIISDLNDKDISNYFLELRRIFFEKISSTPLAPFKELPALDEEFREYQKTLTVKKDQIG